MPNPLHRYLLIHFGHLMTKIEKEANRSFFFDEKSRYGSDELRARLRSEISTNPEVLDILKNGYEVFASQVGERLMRERLDDIFLNFCPKCGALARTPTAKQCLDCFHAWHEVQ